MLRQIPHLLLEDLDSLSQARSSGLLAIVNLGFDFSDLVIGPGRESAIDDDRQPP